MAARRVRRLIHRFQFRRPRVFRDRTDPLMMYVDWQLYERFRFRRHELIEILNEFSPALQVQLATRKGSLPATLQILIALRFFATGSFQAVIADVFNVSKTTVNACIHRVSEVIASGLNRHIHLSSQAEANAMKLQFQAKAGMPNVIGCVDGTHIRIFRPVLDEYMYVNRKGYHSINVQLTCDANLLILHCVVKWPGSVHDSRVMRESNMFHAFELTPPPLDGVFLGDSGYMLKPWLLTPYVNPGSRAQDRYNQAHTTTRSTIERCNGVLKRRWHCLHAELRYSPARACQIIKACLILHNIAVRNRVPAPDGPGIEDGIQEEVVAVNANADVNGRLMRDRISHEFFGAGN